MKVTVKIYGTLTQEISGYDAAKGLTLEFSDGARIKELLARLKIPESKGCFVSMNNIVAKPDDTMTANGTIMILQALAGG